MCYMKMWMMLGALCGDVYEFVIGPHSKLFRSILLREYYTFVVIYIAFFMHCIFLVGELITFFLDVVFLTILS